jgi:opacity protein-like surface antigen
MRLRILLSVMAVCLLASPAAAQSGNGSVGLRAYFLYDSVWMSASDSFDAVLNTSSFKGPGVGIEATDLWKGVFVKFAFAKMGAEEGHRVVFIDSQVISTGVARRVEMAPIEFGAGWRQSLDPTGRFVAYGGASGMWLKYKETSPMPPASATENLDETFNGYAVFAGLDVSVWRNVFAGVEFQYRGIPDAIGQAPAAGAPETASHFYGETDLGGTAFRILFGIRR